MSLSTLSTDSADRSRNNEKAGEGRIGTRCGRKECPEALAIFALRMNEIDLVLTDLAMPFMDGIALIRTLQKMKPDVNVIASTGRGGQEEHANDFAALNVRACLTKPYNKDKLLTTLHDALSPQTDKQ